MIPVVPWVRLQLIVQISSDFCMYEWFLRMPNLFFPFSTRNVVSYTFIYFLLSKKKKNFWHLTVFILTSALKHIQYKYIYINWKIFIHMLLKKHCTFVVIKCGNIRPFLQRCRVLAVRSQTLKTLQFISTKL